jgi:cytochrome c peroxidase
MNTSRLFLGVAGVLAIAGTSWAATVLTVDQRGLTFSTARLTANRGDMVRFTNSDKTSHNILVTGNGVSLNSGLQRPGVAFNAPFARAGTYRVTCGIHPKMKMKVVVR